MSSLPKQKTTVEQNQVGSESNDSSQKYTNISEDSSLSRETTMASVSRIGLAGADPSRPSTAVTRSQSSVSSAADLKRNFEN